MLSSVASAQPLMAYKEALTQRQSRKHPNVFVPDFDPAEAGICARVLFVFEAPGPKTKPSEGGSGFISVDNNDPSAATIWQLRKDADIREYEATHWNTVGWYMGDPTVKPNAQQRAEGIRELRDLTVLLHRLDVIVAGGRIAQDAFTTAAKRNGWPKWSFQTSAGKELPVIPVPHPAGQAMAQKGLRKELSDGLLRVRQLLGPPQQCREHGPSAA